jgi:acetyl coenzyme A synthetase (ADP forming)-like protein
MGLDRTTMECLFYPRGMAVIGSAREGRLGYQLISQIIRGGYEHVCAVNPKAQGVLSAPGYDAVVKIESPVDLAVIASPTSTVPEVLEDCGRAGVGAAVIITAGFSEVGNREGEERLIQVAHQYGMRCVGPNCAGILNTSHNMFATLETHPAAGGVALVAQSGAVGGVVLAWAKENKLGFSKFVSYGNRADLSEIDFLHYLVDDPETKVVALYLESVPDGRHFMEVVSECTQHKPVIVVKSGRTRAGQRAALSHTGSLAGGDEVYDAAFRQCGAIRVRTLEELLDLCKGFVSVSAPRGHRVGIVTNSGGPGVMAADRAEEAGLKVKEPSARVKKALRAFLPPHCPLSNPIDLTVEATEEGYRRAVSTMLDEYDAILALNIAPPYLDSVPLARGISDAASQTEKPVVAAFLPGEIVVEGIEYLEDHGVPNFATGERAVTALAAMAAYRSRNVSKPVLPLAADEQRFLPDNGPMLEPEAMAWLRENWIPVPEFRCAAEREGVLDGCHEIGYPVVMKIVSPEILHKSDVGGVILNIAGDKEALEAFEALAQVPADGGFRCVVIYPMFENAREVLLGLSRDPQFGPVIVFGMGGIFAEIWRDVALRIAPLSRDEAEAMIEEIKAYTLLKGARGQESGDLEALVDLLVRFSRLPFRYPEIDQVDLNPVFLFSRGLTVGDVRVLRRDQRVSAADPKSRLATDPS